MRGINKSQRGDTIIEVMLAFTVFSLLAVGALTVMGRGVQVTQKSLEITLVRQQIDAQAEGLRYINANMDGTRRDQWNSLSNTYASSPTNVKALELQTGGACPLPNTGAFIVNARTGQALSPTGTRSLLAASAGLEQNAPYPHITYDDDSEAIGLTGLWIEAARPSSANFVDFHIKACWYAPGEGPATTIGSIVRLYAPAS